MKKIAAIILIIIGLGISVLSIREYTGKNKHIDILGYELSLQNKKAKKIFCKNVTIGALTMIGGVALLTVGKKKQNG